MVQGAIQAGDLPGILCMDVMTLLQLNHRHLTVEEVLQCSGVLIEKEEIPRSAILMPVATVEVLLELQRRSPRHFTQCLSMGGD